MQRTTLRRLEVFVVAVEAGGFRAGSDRLGISQAAVSSQIRQLEDELGYALFVRRAGAAPGLTARGATAYREAKDLLDHASQLTAIGGTGARPAAARLAVFADAVLDAELAGHISRFMAARPGVDVSLERARFEDSLAAFNSGRADILYFYAAGPMREIESELVRREPVCICAHESHDVFRTGMTGLADLRRRAFVAPLKGTHFRRAVDRMLSGAGLADYPIAFESGNPNIAREAVISGQAISACIARYCDEELSRHGVRRIPLPGVELSLEVRRAVRRELRFDRSALALTDFIGGDTPPGRTAIPA